MQTANGICHKQQMESTMDVGLIRKSGNGPENVSFESEGILLSVIYRHNQMRTCLDETGNLWVAA